MSTASAHHRKTADPHDKDLGFERLVFFSDAIFAIAITILVLDLKLQVGPHGEILFDKLIPKLTGFVISFSVTGIYWLAHHRLFKTLRTESTTLRVVNLMFLAGVVFLAFPTTVISEYPATTWAVIFYALSVATTGVLHAGLVLVARRPQLMRGGETRGGTLKLFFRALSPPLVFTSTCFVALTQPMLAMLLWMTLPIISRVLSFTGEQIGSRMDRRAVSSRPH